MKRVLAGPTWRVLLALVLGVLLLHGVVLLGAVSPLSLQLQAPAPAAPVQVRVVMPTPPAAIARPAARRTPRPAAWAPKLTEAQAPEPEQAASEPMVAAASEPTAPQLASAPQTPAPAAAAPQPAASTAAEPANEQFATTAWPLIPLGVLPSSRLLSYQLTGMDKGFTYHAGGELRWQHNDTAYELSLTVKAFLLGSRHWRSVGQIEATGLVPRKFSDSWRNERAAHFDREQQRIVFSSNSKPVPWQPGVQDQVSLYVQLAAAMAGEPERFVPGTRLQVQTVTVRDALPWSLVLEGEELLNLQGQPQKTVKWVGQPRHQFDTRVEFWLAQTQAWLPVRIRITQTSGSYIDLALRSAEPLPPLPVANEKSADAKGS